MPKVSKRKMQSCKAYQSSAATRQREKLVCVINQTLMEMNDDELQQIYQNVIQLNNNEVETSINNIEASGNEAESKKVEINNKKVATNTHHQKLIKIIEKLPDNQLKSAIHLLENM